MAPAVRKMEYPIPIAANLIHIRNGSDEVRSPLRENGNHDSIGIKSP